MVYSDGTHKHTVTVKFSVALGALVFAPLGAGAFNPKEIRIAAPLGSRLVCPGTAASDDSAWFGLVAAKDRRN